MRRTISMTTEIKRELLNVSPLADLPGWEMRMFLIVYPPGGDGSNHSHPVVGIGYVLEGTMISAFDDDPEKTFVAGESFIDKASFHRVSRNGSDTEFMRFVIAYTVKVGEPNTTWPN
jgi:quercetin dioxygenase-like cupin family protein